MKRALVTISILAVALLTISGRPPASVKAAHRLGQMSDLSDPQKGDEQREEFHQSYALSANGRVSLENINGGVHITVWDQNQVKVDAVKHAYNRERLAEAKIEVDTIADGVRIRTRYPDRDQTFNDEGSRRYNNPASVDYSLTIPRQARLESVDVINGKLDIEGVEGDVKASSINGHVRATGLMGEARLSTVNGPLEATFSKLTEAKALSLNSVNGNITLVIPSDSNAQLRAGTLHGAITNDFGLPVNDGRYIGHELNGQLGAGGPRIKLGNVNGAITIKHANDGRPMSPVTSLLSDKDNGDNPTKARIRTRDINRQVREEVRAEVDAAKIAREAQAEAQRDVQEALRESQREIQRAQIEIQRDIQRQINDQLRAEIGRRTHGIRTGRGRFTDRETKSFSVSGTPSVNVGTFDGSVVVHGWDKPEVSYTAIKRADSDEAAKRITIASSQQGSAISIIAKSDDSNGSASLEIYLPRNTNLHLSSEDGRLIVQGVSGELIARTGDGSIEVEGGKGRIQANTGDGRIRISNFEGEVDARTGDGSITLDGNFSVVSARTGDGSIVLGVPAGANFVVETNADALSNEGLSITEDVAPSTRVKRWKVGRGGAVFTLNTGDGRVVLRTR
ncbi:MAG TPA: hypothetical protein VN920_07940 [Pyrinomonadaceae bacterium]|nr:hypothetical protein [Pyrinomonadaceae bacterium]